MRTSAKSQLFLPDSGQESCGKAPDAATLMTVMNEPCPQDLVRHVAASTGLPETTATRVVADVAAYFAETVEEFVSRRHEELKRKQLKNDEIWPLIAAELGARRFRVRELSGRQMRRIVYS
jgi:tRNA(His) 5'-end guanylyltransferase